VGLQVDPMTVKIDNVQGVKSPIIPDIAGSYQIGLLEVIEPQDLLEVGIFNSFRNIRSFF
jgi:hypothetical protein